MTPMSVGHANAPDHAVWYARAGSWPKRVLSEQNVQSYDK